MTIQRFEYDCPVAVIGDIHGCAGLLESLLAALGPDIPILVMGDLVDRGPDSKKVLDLLIARGAKGVQGNHEEWFKMWVNRVGFDRFALAPVMGGAATLASYGVRSTSTSDIESAAWRVPHTHVDFVNSLALIGDLKVMGKEYWMIHAGVSDKIPKEWRKAEMLIPSLAQYHRQDCLWGGHYPYKCPSISRPVIMGHMALKDGPLNLKRVIAIDTGAGFDDAFGLTAVVLPLVQID